MYAIIEQGSKQYKISEGETLDIELTEVKPDAKTLEMDKVLMVSDGKDIKIGNPYIEGARVIASFKSNASESVVKGLKVYPTYFRRRKSSHKRIGHRQKYLRVTIDKISV